MATTRNLEAERRSKVAEACLEFGSDLLRARTSSVTPDDAQNVVKELFTWFEAEEAFKEGNFGIAIRSLEFGTEMLKARKTTTLDETVAAVQKLYRDLAE
jgi:hypothetical protein